MRILFLSNLFPPGSLGGYEEWCLETAVGLRARGHEVTVLTSRTRPSAPAGDPPWVRRELHLEMELASLRNAVEFFTRRRARERENLAILRRHLETDPPDRIVVWGMWNVPRSAPALVEDLMPDRTAYYMGDYWPTLPSQWRNYWQVQPRNWLTALPKLLLRAPAMRMLAREPRPPLALARVMFPSRFLRAELARLGIEPRQAPVICGAIDTQPYLELARGEADRESLRLLYVGRLSADKGVHLAIEAMGILAGEKGNPPMRLAIAGAGEPEYEARLRELVVRHRLEGRVELLGAQPKEALPGLYRDADVLLFPSVWPEPFGRAPVEAMASGLAVVGAPVGGAAEFLADEETALCFEPGDATGLARQIARLARDPELRRRLARNARRLAAERFDVQRMTVEIEAFLQDMKVPRPSSAPPPAAIPEPKAMEAQSR